MLITTGGDDPHQNQVEKILAKGITFLILIHQALQARVADEIVEVIIELLKTMM